MPGTFVIVTPKGDVKRERFEGKFDLQAVYPHIGNTLAARVIVSYEGRNRDCWVDEEGLLKGKEPNGWVTRNLSGVFTGYSGVIVGTGVIVIPDARPNVKAGRMPQRSE